MKLVTEQGRSFSEAARSLGIASELLRRWKATFQAEGPQAFPGHSNLPPAEDAHNLETKWSDSDRLNTAASLTGHYSTTNESPFEPSQTSSIQERQQWVNPQLKQLADGPNT